MLTALGLIGIAAGMLISAGALVHLWLASQKVDKGNEAIGRVSRRARKRRALKVERITRTARAVLAAAFILGSVPALAIVVDETPALATPFAQEPGGPQLSDEEQAAIDAKRAGKDYDPKLATSGERKLDTQEKYKGERNKQKQRGGHAGDEFEFYCGRRERPE
jgi:hypothetical protein